MAILQNETKPKKSIADDNSDQLYLRYFSGQISKNKLSKQNELYIQHLLTQSEDYKKKKVSTLNQSKLQNTLSFSGKENLGINSGVNTTVGSQFPTSTTSQKAIGLQTVQETFRKELETVKNQFKRK